MLVLFEFPSVCTSSQFKLLIVWDLLWRRVSWVGCVLWCIKSWPAHIITTFQVLMKTAHLLSGMKKNKQCIFLYGRPVKTYQSAHPRSLISLHCSRESRSTPSDPGRRVIRGFTSFCVGLADVRFQKIMFDRWILSLECFFPIQKMQRKGMLPATVLKMPLTGQLITSFWRHEVVSFCACYWCQILWRPRNAYKYVKPQRRVLTVLELT